MKKDFKNINQQMTYINKFIQRKTDLQKICQICGKPAQVRHNQVNPYAVQFLCKSCKVNLGISNKSVDAYIIDLPIINVLDHINSPIKPFKYRNLSEHEKFIIDDSIKNRLTKSEIHRKHNVSYYSIEKILEKYEEIKPGITDKFNKAVYEGRRTLLYNNAMKRHSYDESNILYKIKLERQLTSKDIAKLCNNQITVGTINLIIEGKSKNPKMKTKQILAKGLGMSIDELFPNNVK